MTHWKYLQYFHGSFDIELLYVCIHCNLRLNIIAAYTTPFIKHCKVNHVKSEKGICKNLNIRDIIINFINEVFTRWNFNDNDFYLVHLSVSILNFKILLFFRLFDEIMAREILTGDIMKFPPKYSINSNTYMANKVFRH